MSFGLIVPKVIIDRLGDRTHNQNRKLERDHDCDRGRLETSRTL
jgi:hypothetical protein